MWWYYGPKRAAAAQPDFTFSDEVDNQGNKKRVIRYNGKDYTITEDMIQRAAKIGGLRRGGLFVVNLMVDQGGDALKTARKLF